MIEIRGAQEWHAEALAPLMRKQDADEVYASGGYTPLEAILAALEASPRDFMWTALEDGVPFCMWGAAPHADFSRLGIVWLLGSPRIYAHKRRFWIESWRYVSIMQKEFDTLANYVDMRNTTSQRWLEALGFEIVGLDEEHGHSRIPFFLYARYR